MIPTNNLQNFFIKQAEKPSYLKTLLRGMGRGALVGGVGGGALGGYLGGAVADNQHLLDDGNDDPSFWGSVGTGAGVGGLGGAALGAGVGGIGNVLERFFMANTLATMSEAAQSGNVDQDLLALIQAAQTQGK